MTRPSDVAIASPPLGRLHRFGSVDLEGASSIRRRGRSSIVPNQDYGEEWEESPSAQCSKGSLWCEQYVARHYRATAVIPVTAVQVCCGEQTPNVRSLRHDKNWKDASFYHQCLDFNLKL
jgi:hypothetical protein